ncbi:hypothetical protein FG386_000524 [Cryptosporidium ryanae]|uniref:uncharacterized protein n=1 Tax=Cryptosporidium ryanae TaxID=515981 RepID=UPI00351A05FD|nr:hypothetical protein FG386_000524 [Cryptosporidium ryanae]
MVLGSKKADLSSLFDSVKHKNRGSNINPAKSNDKTNRFATFGLKNKQDYGERRKLLLRELYKEGRCGEFSDERDKFSTNKEFSLSQNAKNIIATKHLKRVSVSKGRKRKLSFNLEGEEDDDNYDLDFTHKGMSLSSINDREIKKYKDLGDDCEEFSEEYIDKCCDKGVLDDKVIPGFFFGQGGDPEVSNSNADSNPKSRQELFREIMQKSKVAKMEMRRHKEALEEELLNLDDSFRDVQSLLTFKKSKKERINSLISAFSNGNVENAELERGKLKESETSIMENDDYERIRSELKFDTRSGVSDRIKTKEEIAKINLNKLEKLEQERRKRMKMDVNFEFDSEEEQINHSQIETAPSETGSTDFSEEESDTNGDLSEDELDFDSSDKCTVLEDKDRINGINQKFIKEFLEFDEKATINWLRNEDNEEGLPFSVNLKKLLPSYNLDALLNFLGNFPPISQWKFISRFRACFSNSDAGKLDDLKLLFGFLIKYPLKCIRYMQNNLDLDNVDKSIFRFILKYLKLMAGHLLFMSEADPKECLIIFTYFALDICLTTFPDVKKSIKIEKFLNEQLLNADNEHYYTEILEECHSLYEDTDEIYEPTLEHILICRMIFLIFPVTDAHHPILTPVICCLEQWAYRWSQIGKAFLNPTESGSNYSKHNQIKLVNNPNLDCVVGLINLLEIASIGYCNKTNSDVSENIERFSIGYFSLSLSCLKWIIADNKNLCLKNICISIGILKSLIRVIDKFKDIQGFYVPLIHLVIPNMSEIRSYMYDSSSSFRKRIGSEHNQEMTSLISDILNACTYISNKKLRPVNLCIRQTPTIKSLTPKLDDSSVPFAAKAMLKAKHNPKESQHDLEKRLYLSKLKREVNTARRQANRQIRRDSQVLASIYRENKMAKTLVRDSKYNSFMKMLQDDQEEYKKMKTTGGTMDTSIESYRSSKKKKKENRRMGGNRTETGIVH